MSHCLKATRAAQNATLNRKSFILHVFPGLALACPTAEQNAHGIFQESPWKGSSRQENTVELNISVIFQCIFDLKNAQTNIVHENWG
jgi:hypothetical protein